MHRAIAKIYPEAHIIKKQKLARDMLSKLKLLCFVYLNKIDEYFNII